jgi:pimeloyl-ACP methyl ester carboxylesterase
MRLLGRVVTIGLATAVSFGTFLVTTPPDVAAATGVVDMAVTFSVVNQNRSHVPCQSDGATYSVRGHLIGPTSNLGGPAPRVITVYMHNLGWAQYYWHFKAVSGYDYATEMARLGHTSLVYDLLGYGASDHPPGTQVCYGSQADIAHQIIGDLRSGTYHAGGVPTVTFQKVALASAGDEALSAQPEAYSFNDIDALIITSWADWIPTATLLTQTVQIGMFCGNGGEPQGGTTGPPGYAYVPLSATDFRSDYFANGNPTVVDAATQMRTRSPCGELNSAQAAIAEDEALLPTITVPVLLVYGNQDVLWNQPSSGQNNKIHFVGSSSVTADYIDQAGQALALERTAPRFRDAISQWLCANLESCPLSPDSQRSRSTAVQLATQNGNQSGLPSTATDQPASGLLLAIGLGALACLTLTTVRTVSHR